MVPNYRRNLMKSIIGMVLLIATLITACWSCGPALINKYGLKDKSQAIEMVVSEYESSFLEPELRPEYVEKLKRIEKGKFHRYDSIDALRKEIDNA